MPLTARELEVVAGIGMGKRSREVADALVISPATARTHVRNAMTKLGARSQAQLVAIALAAGMLDPEQVNPAHDLRPDQPRRRAAVIADGSGASR
jgi:DNA-binding CsgD family transcriptional regulator